VATNGHDLPILVVGGGIGGLVTAYALALKGFPVRVLEQAPEFKELGAGIQLGPNIFRVLDKIGLKDAVLADAWVPNGMEMRNALNGSRVTRVELGQTARERFQQPYAVTHRTDIHGAYLAACRGHNLVSLENNRTVDAIRDDGASVIVILSSGEEIRGVPSLVATACGRKCGGKSSATDRPASPVTSPIAPCSSARMCRRTCGARMSFSGPAPARISSIIHCAGANSTTSSPCSIPTITKKAGTSRATPRS
jgi:salicylate hydroxylase